MHSSVFLVFGVLAFSVVAQKNSLPVSPCPDIFRYVRDEDGTHYGEINVPATSGTLHVKMVTFDPIRAKPKNPRLERFGGNDENDRKSLFRVKFHSQDPLPEVDKILVDNVEVCTGNIDPSRKLTSSFKLSQTSRRSSSSRSFGSSSQSRSRSRSHSSSSFYRNHTSYSQF